MNDMKIFENSEFGAVRVVDVNGEPWFVARDVASALGYVDTTQAIRMHCEKAKDFRGVEMTATATPMKIIPEEDVYALIFGSHLESAKQFRRWICDEVLPAIRKHGGYLHKGGSARNMPTQRCIDAGWMEIKEGTRIGSSGECHITRTPKVTGKGQIYFVNLFREMKAA